MNKYKNKAYNTIFPSDEPKLRESLSVMEGQNAYFLNDMESEIKYISHIGFENLSDIEEYIQQIKEEINSYEQKWNGSANRQGLNDRTEELSTRISVKKKIYKDFPEELIEPEYKRLMEEYKELLIIQKEELEKYNALKIKLEELLEIKKVWLAKLKEDNSEVFKYVSKIQEQLEYAEIELKELEKKDYPEHYKTMRKKELEEIITYLNSRLPRKKKENSIIKTETQQEETAKPTEQTNSVTEIRTKKHDERETQQEEIEEKNPVYYTEPELRRIFREYHPPKSETITNGEQSFTR